MDDLEHPREPAPRLVFFDLDGTISRHDTLIGYVTGYALRHPWRLLGFLRVLPALAAYFAVHRDRGRLKAALIHAVMGGASRTNVDAWTAEYVPRLLRRGVFAEALQAIRHHREAGDHLILMSATVDLYVPELARVLGFDEYICTPVAWRGDRLEGSLTAPNVRDEEKARQLKRVAVRFAGRRLVGYGNSAPDLPHLRLVDQAYLINPNGRLRKAAKDLPAKFKLWI